MREFANMLFNSVVDFVIKTKSEYVKYDYAIIQAKTVHKDPSNYLMMVRRFKAYYYSVLTKRTKIAKPGTQLVCTYFSDSDYLIPLTEQLDDLIKISPHWDPAKKAYLLQLCDILIVQNSIDVSLIFLLKPSITLLALNSDSKWINYAESLWNIKIISQKLSPSSSGSVSSIISLIRILRDRNKSKYFFFMPWEQLNNQIIGFKAACAMAKALDRILVLPFLGYRKSDDWDFTFDVKTYSWSPMEKYFDFHDLPCEIITLSNFKIVNGINIGHVYYNPVAKATSFEQITDYYDGILGLNVASIKNQSRLFQLNENTVLKLFGRDRSKVLSFGALFWTYGFGKEQEYPLKQYISYMDNALYRQITLGIRTKMRIQQYAQSSMSKRIGQKSLITAHIRRGDYWKKCKAIMDPLLQAHCYPSIENIKSKIKEVVERRQKNAFHGIPGAIHSVWDEDSYYVYVSTNLGADRSELNELLELYPVLFFEDIFRQKDLKTKRLDPIHISLLDKEIGIGSHEFIGNFYSSFSRTIFEGREIENKSSISF